MKSHLDAFLLSGFVLISAAVCGQAPQPAPAKPAMHTGILLVRSDKAASLLIDGKSVGDLAAGGFLKVSEVAGEHFIEAREKGGICKWEKKVTIPLGMQAAEVVDFAATCPSKSDAGTPTSSSVNNAPPITVAPLAPVDPKIQEAQDLHERGCRLFFLDRDSEAVPLLEKAASLIPSLDGQCLRLAQTGLQKAKERLAACANPESPNEPRQTSCRSKWLVWGYKLGNLGSFSYLDSGIHSSEANQWAGNEFAASGQYERRALYEYALGNPSDALRDLQTALDWNERRNAVPGTPRNVTEATAGYDWERIHLERAVIEADTGNNEAAGQDCRLTLTSEPAYNKPERDFCSRMAAGFAAPDSGNTGSFISASDRSTSVDDAIKRIQGGQYSPMPPAQVFVRSGTGSPRLTIENGTQYEIRVYLSGPETHTVSVPAGGSSVLDLTAGAFKLAAEIPNSSIIPFYGEQTFNGGAAYVEKFYIQRVP